MRDTGIDWERLAQANPYWAVLTEDEFKDNVSGETLASFFARGQQDVNAFLEQIHGLFPSFAPPFESLIDFGCGAGRLIIPMAQMAKQAYGIDVSKTMREATLRNAAEAGLDNIECFENPETLVKQGTKVDWVNSFIVLQHVEPRRGYFLINDLLQCVKPGGIASLHIPLFKSAERMDYMADRVHYFRNDYYHTETVFIDRDNYEHPDIQMYDYDANTIMALFHKNQMTRVHVLHDGSSSGIHSYYFIARRSL